MTTMIQFWDEVEVVGPDDVLSASEVEVSVVLIKVEVSIVIVLVVTSEMCGIKGSTS